MVGSNIRFSVAVEGLFEELVDFIVDVVTIHRFFVVTEEGERMQEGGCINIFRKEGEETIFNW
jgi:hypothetical protein